MPEEDYATWARDYTDSRQILQAEELEDRSEDGAWVYKVKLGSKVNQERDVDGAAGESAPSLMLPLALLKQRYRNNNH